MHSGQSSLNRNGPEGWKGRGAAHPQGFEASCAHLGPDHRNSEPDGNLEVTKSKPFMLWRRKPNLGALPKVEIRAEAGLGPRTLYSQSRGSRALGSDLLLSGLVCAAL